MSGNQTAQLSIWTKDPLLPFGKSLYQAKKDRCFLQVVNRGLYVTPGLP